ncbi:MAG: hypothetical protein WAM71_06210 [Candidatus Korobacteraceae bacterium]
MHNTRTLSRSFVLAATIAAVFASCCCAQKQQDPANQATGERQSDTSQFEAFFTKFKEAVRANNVESIADAINFPFYVYSHSYSRTQFVHDKNEQVNFFTPYVRTQILKSSMDDLLTYKNKEELGQADPSYAFLPEKSPVFELDIINNHGGPAMRLMFARADSGYKLFCLVQ